MPKSQRPRVANLISMPAIDRPVDASEGEIASRAYELFLERGAQHGHDVEDWLQAERELRGAATSTAA